MVNFGSHSKFEKSAKDDFSGEQIHEQGRHTFYAILIKGAGDNVHASFWPPV